MIHFTKKVETQSSNSGIQEQSNSNSNGRNNNSSRIARENDRFSMIFPFSQNLRQNYVNERIEGRNIIISSSTNVRDNNNSNIVTNPITQQNNQEIPNRYRNLSLPQENIRV